MAARPRINRCKRARSPRQRSSSPSLSFISYSLNVLSVGSLDHCVLEMEIPKQIRCKPPQPNERGWDGMLYSTSIHQEVGGVGGRRGENRLGPFLQDSGFVAWRQQGLKRCKRSVGKGLHTLFLLMWATLLWRVIWMAKTLSQGFQKAKIRERCRAWVALVSSFHLSIPIIYSSGIWICNTTPSKSNGGVAKVADLSTNFTSSAYRRKSRRKISQGII